MHRSLRISTGSRRVSSRHGAGQTVRIVRIDQAEQAAAPNRFKALAATIVSVALVATAVITPAPVSAEETSGGEIATKALDVMVLRPGGVLRLAVGSAFLLPASLFNLAALPFQGKAVYTETVDLLVLQPFRYTFQRPLGEDLEGE